MFRTQGEEESLQGSVVEREAFARSGQRVVIEAARSIGIDTRGKRCKLFAAEMAGEYAAAAVGGAGHQQQVAG